MFWNTTNDNTVDMSIGRYYTGVDNMKASTPEGYRCDPLDKSPVVFLGSCDMSGPIIDPEQVWAKVIYNKLSQIYEPFPYIALSRIHSGTDALTRRLNAYCVKYGAPKKIFVVLPRPVCLEIPVRGTLVNVTERPNYVDYLLKINRITPSEHTMCMKAVEFSRSQQDSVEYQTYQFERIGTMLRLLCRNYDIEMRWTPNLSATAVDYYARWMDVFLRQMSFMADTCAGVGVLRDFATPEDGSTGLLTQASIAEVLMSSDGRNSLEAINAQLTSNHHFLVNAEPEHYEKVISAARI
jgi:hypothetical protein